MKYILTQEECDIPEKVSVKINARNVEVTGPRGTLKQAFKHVPVEILQSVNKKTKSKSVLVQMWLSKKKQRCRVRTVTSTIKNMIKGVTSGFKYTMRMANAHFPIQAITSENGKILEIKNFLGEKMTRKIVALPGVTVFKPDDASGKDLIIFTGNDLHNVSQTAALVQQSCRVKDKDIRQFLDGVYIDQRRLDAE